MTIDVYLDTAKSPPVTVVPPIKDKDKGKDTITWKPAKGQDFTLVSVTFANNPGHFGPGSSNPDGKEITVEDDNSGGASVGDFPYTVVVSYQGKQYSSAATGPGGVDKGPIIHNKPN